MSQSLSSCNKDAHALPTRSHSEAPLMRRVHFKLGVSPRLDVGSVESHPAPTSALIPVRQLGRIKDKSSPNSTKAESAMATMAGRATIVDRAWQLHNLLASYKVRGKILSTLPKVEGRRSKVKNRVIHLHGAGPPLYRLYLSFHSWRLHPEAAVTLAPSPPPCVAMPASARES